MQQAVAELFDEDRTTWWEALQAGRERDETPKLAGPQGPGWLRAVGGLAPDPPDAASARPGE